VEDIFGFVFNNDKMRWDFEMGFFVFPVGSL